MFTILTRLKPLYRFYSTNKSLRPYQQECIDKCITALKQGIKKQVVSLPVGSGKTVIFSNLLSHVPSPAIRPRATKTLVLAHREELIEQARNGTSENTSKNS